MLNVVRYGSASPEALPLVLIHGFTQTSEIWAPNANILAKEFEVLCPDLPGHGATDPQYDSADLWRVGDLLVETCGEANYVGYSFGARALMHAALSHPDAVRSAVLIGGRPGFHSEAERNERRWADAQLAAHIDAGGQMGLPNFIDEWLAQPFNIRIEPSMRFREARLKNRAAGLAASLRHCGAGEQDNLWDRLPELNMPVLLMRGEFDLPWVHDVTDEMNRLIGENASMSVIDGAGHGCPVEKPERFAEIITDFLSR